MNRYRTILHSDLNSFYSSVEMMLNPALQGKAVAVCGSTEDRHGIVLAKSEKAKKAGVKTGMVNWEAKQRCPDLIIVPPQYFKHADGRDSGLGEIDPDSPTEFSTWYHDSNRHGGHPWEVCRGGNSTHIDLYVVADNDGYSLRVAGSSTWRSVEAIKFFLALHRAGLPVVISQAELLKSRLLGMEKVGIVPVGVWPAYCQSRFPNEDVEAFINLPREDEEKMIPRCVWQPLTQIELQ